jgi:hypothetical protein
MLGFAMCVCVGGGGTMSSSDRRFSGGVVNDRRQVVVQWDDASTVGSWQVASGAKGSELQRRERGRCRRSGRVEQQHRRMSVRKTMGKNSIELSHI